MHAFYVTTTLKTLATVYEDLIYEEKSHARSLVKRLIAQGFKEVTVYVKKHRIGLALKELKRTTWFTLKLT